MPDTPASAPAIEFWFDFASGYAYFAAKEIGALAARHGRSLRWRPFSLGSAFKVTGATGLSRTPLKSDYARRDWARLARRGGLPFRLPEHHARTGLAALRGFYHVDRRDRATAALLAPALVYGYFETGLDIDDPLAVADVGSRFGLDRDHLLAGIADPDVKALARSAGDAAVAAGIFGSPWIVVDGEPFWGHDRLAEVDAWLSEGAW